MTIRIMKVRILWRKLGIIACCSQMCDEDCPDFNKCKEYEIIVIDPG